MWSIGVVVGSRGRISSAKKSKYIHLSVSATVYGAKVCTNTKPDLILILLHHRFLITGWIGLCIWSRHYALLAFLRLCLLVHILCLLSGTSPPPFVQIASLPVAVAAETFSAVDHPRVVRASVTPGIDFDQ